jgi:predicted ATPase/DNA-binding SARP family transcriptional activator
VGGVAEVAFRLLGPLKVTVDGRPVGVGGPRPRGLLALLLTAGGGVVSEDGLVDGLWGDDPPPSARKTVQSHLSRLRAALGPAGDRLRREPGGYRLELRPGELDVGRVEALVARAREARAAAPAQAARLLAEALAVWRGPALAGVEDLPGLAAERVRLDELRLGVADELLDARLAAGEHHQALPEVERAAAAQPLRERTQLLLAVARYRCGRHADALEALRRYRERLAEETGLDPTDELARTEAAILARAAWLNPPAPASAAPAVDNQEHVPSGSATLPHRGAAPGAGSLEAAPRGLAPGAGPMKVAPATLPPPPAAPLVGRELELERLDGELGRHRLVTVTGVGGVGKTRLAMEAARRIHAAGRPVVALELAEIGQAEAVAPALAARLGVRPGPAMPVEDAIAEYLSTQRLLLVVDNCEHLLAVVARLLDRIVRQAPQVTVLASSRERLGLDAEQVLPLPPLPLPAGDGPARPGPAQPASVLLFADRARRARPSFQLSAANLDRVGEICRRLDGLPLALELAAGRLNALGLDDLGERLGQLDLLARPPAGEGGARHRTLRAVIDWSYRLLDDPERRLFDAVSVFDGGFGLAAAEQVAGADGLDPEQVPAALARLVDASMVMADEDPVDGGRLRYRLLETTRHHGRASLAGQAGAAAAVFRRHGEWAAAFAEAAEQALRGPEEAAWWRRVDAELPNLRGAWHRALGDGRLEVAARIAVALGEHAYYRGRAEIWTWLRRLADQPALAGSPLAAAVLGEASQAAWFQGDLAAAEALALRGLATAGPADPGRWRCLEGLATVRNLQAAYCESERRYAEAADAPGCPATRSAALRCAVALPRLFGGDVDGARAIIDAARPAADRTGHATSIAMARYIEGEVALRQDPARAIAPLTEAIALARSVGIWFVNGIAGVALVSAHTRLGDRAAAVGLYPDLVRHWQRSGNWILQWTTLRNLVELLVDLGLHEDAALILGAADAADQSATVTGPDAARLQALQAELAAALGGERLRQAAAQGASLPRAQVVERALETLERAALAVGAELAVVPAGDPGGREADPDPLGRLP